MGFAAVDIIPWYNLPLLLARSTKSCSFTGFDIASPIKDSISFSYWDIYLWLSNQMFLYVLSTFLARSRLSRWLSLTRSLSTIDPSMSNIRSLIIFLSSKLKFIFSESLTTYSIQHFQQRPAWEYLLVSLEEWEVCSCVYVC